MSGANVPYQLRPNKFVERQLFLEALEHIGRLRQIAKYVYVSMGGRFLEDFKWIHRRLRVQRLVSLECDDTLFDRQVFNRPLSLIRCRNQKTGDFVQEFDAFASKYTKGRNFIIWFDYASPKNRQQQLQEIESLVSKLTAFDIVKVTLNANIATLGESTEPNHEQGKFDKLKSGLGDFLPGWVTSGADVNHDTLPRILVDAVQTAALRGIAGSASLAVLPIACFKYQDIYHQMVTAAFILVNADDRAKVLSKKGLGGWEYFSGKWEDVHQIAVPDLSLKERIVIDEMLFADSLEQAHAKMPFRLDEKKQRSLDALRQYFEHYRRYPSFVHANL